MPVRSWLAKAKSVHDIGGEFSAARWGAPDEDKRDEQAERRWRRHLERPVPVEPADAPYYGCAMHDSGILGVERAKGELRVRLDSINARDFASHLAEALDVPRVEAVYPVDLVLHDAAYVRAATVDRRGGLRFADPKGLAGTEFLYDWFHEQEGRLQWIAQIWDGRGHTHRERENVYLMVDCARAAARDRSPEVLARAYGAPAADLYRDAVARIDDRPIDFSVYDGGRHTERYILRRMAARGLARRDFRLASPFTVGAE